MDAKDYLEKVQRIYEAYTAKGCMEKCPLNNYGCGIPQEKSGIKEVIAVIEKIELSELYPYGICQKCGYEFNSELINEYEIKHCPKCGKKIEGEDNGV